MLLRLSSSFAPFALEDDDAYLLRERHILFVGDGNAGNTLGFLNVKDN